jgi:hypothetical protein
MTLPICELTEIPRLLCHHCESFTMTEGERAYLTGRFGPGSWTAEQIRARGEYGHLVVDTTDYRHSKPWSEPMDVKVVDSTVLCRVPGCTRPSGDAFVCPQCLDDLEVALADVPALMEDLTVLTMRQARFTRAQVGSDRTPLPYSPHAAARAAELANALTTGIRMLCERVHQPYPDILNADEASRWLLSHLHSVGQDEGGPDITADILREVKRARVAIDCPPEKLYIGICEECKTAMHATKDQPEHRCTTCGTTYVVAKLVLGIKQRFSQYLLTVGQLERLMNSTYAGLKVSRHRINRLASASRLPRRGVDRDGVALYRASDLLEILEAERQEG